MSKKKFKSGETVIWDGPNTFNSYDWWDGLSENDRIKYYGDFL